MPQQLHVLLRATTPLSSVTPSTRRLYRALESGSFLSQWLQARQDASADPADLAATLAVGQKLALLGAVEYEIVALELQDTRYDFDDASSSVVVSVSEAEAAKPTPSAFLLRREDAWVRSCERQCRRKIGGLRRPLDRSLRSLYRWLKWFHLAAEERLALEFPPPFGALVFGAPGTGKSLMVDEVCKAAGLPTTKLQAPTLFQRDHGQSERLLKDVFDRCVLRKPSILVVEGVDAICRREEGASLKRGASARWGMMQAFRSALDRIAPTSHSETDAAGATFVFAVTSLLQDELDASVRTSTRLSEKIYCDVPDVESRVEILERHVGDLPLGERPLETLREVAERCHGYSGADLQLLCTEVVIRLAARRDAGEIAADEGASSIRIFHECIDAQPPSLLKMQTVVSAETVPPNPGQLPPFWPASPTEFYNPLPGYGDVVAEVASVVLMPFENPELCRRLGADHTGGVLVHGPSGTGKTVLVRAVAAEALHRFGVRFLCVTCPDILQAAVGASEHRVSELFEAARAVAPCIVFLDQVEAIAARRSEIAGDGGAMSRLLSLLLMEIDECVAGSSVDSAVTRPRQSVILMAATSAPLSILDPAILRPGRIDRIVEMKRPSRAALREIYVQFLQNTPVKLPARVGERTLASVEEVAGFAATHTSLGATGGDVAGVMQRAAVASIREGGLDEVAVSIKMEHICDAIAETRVQNL